MDESLSPALLEDNHKNEMDPLIWDTFQLPDPIVSGMQELSALVNKYPIEIPVPVAAKFLKTNPDSLRAAIDAGNFPAGYSWIKPAMKNKGYCIPTIPFYLWYTQRAGVLMELFRRELQANSLTA